MMRCPLGVMSWMMLGLITSVHVVVAETSCQGESLSFVQQTECLPLNITDLANRTNLTVHIKGYPRVMIVLGVPLHTDTPFKMLWLGRLSKAYGVNSKVALWGTKNCSLINHDIEFHEAYAKFLDQEILSAKEYRAFWLDWADNRTISAGRGRHAGHGKKLSYTFSTPLVVAAVYIASDKTRFNAKFDAPLVGYPCPSESSHLVESTRFEQRSSSPLSTRLDTDLFQSTFRSQESLMPVLPMTTAKFRDDPATRRSFTQSASASMVASEGMAGTASASQSDNSIVPISETRQVLSVAGTPTFQVPWRTLDTVPGSTLQETGDQITKLASFGPPGGKTSFTLFRTTQQTTLLVNTRELPSVFITEVSGEVSSESMSSSENISPLYGSWEVTETAHTAPVSSAAVHVMDTVTTSTAHTDLIAEPRTDKNDEYPHTVSTSATLEQSFLNDIDMTSARTLFTALESSTDFFLPLDSSETDVDQSVRTDFRELPHQSKNGHTSSAPFSASTSSSPMSSASTTLPTTYSTNSSPSTPPPASPGSARRWSRSQRRCKCVRKDRLINMSTVETVKEQSKTVETIVSALSLPTTNMSATVRKKMSAVDERHSSSVIGSLWALASFLPLFGIVMADVMKAVRHVWAKGE